MRRVRIALLTLSFAALLAAPSAQAGERRIRAQHLPKGGEVDRTVTRTGPAGRTSTTHDEIHRNDDGYTRSTTHTGPNGGVTMRNATGSYDAGTRTWTRDVGITRPDGSSVSKQVTRQATPATH